ncbi:TetR/AcrR family transcriptional regulator [Glaciihabitans sp. dw_435]|uniref:TetR/AcrR family transcriptional regulator n=1 Tax=Glaciihabitans sp. dw_435 TaxID=2720081 RepID=UPI001BD283B8|nr:TetR/AcrR family transcriptional regulator [Glaciihabitans sp. dw_435]
MTDSPSRALRADAQLNHDRVLEVAAELFATDGADTSMKSLATAAGVGVGTLYRRFPSREILIEAVYRTETTKLAEAAATLLETMTPITALRTWMGMFVSYMLAKYGMAEALKAVLLDGGELRMETRQRLVDALSLLLTAAEADGSIRTDLPPLRILMGISGIVLIADEFHEAGLTDQLLDLQLDGLRFNAPK